MASSPAAAVAASPAAAAAAVTAEPWPQRCCGREFQSQRALDGHLRSHLRCESCGFEGNPRALGDHACGDAAAAPRVIGTTTEYLRADGSPFTVVDEPDVPQIAIEDGYPGARVVWPAQARDEIATASAAAPDVAAPHLPSECRVVLILGATGAGKSRLLTALAAQAGTATTPPPRWARDEAVVSQFGDDPAAALRWLTAVGLN